MATPEIGRPAPALTLPGLVVRDGVAERSDYSLAAYRGSPIVLAFYPGDETPVCTKQMCAYASELEQFNRFGAQVWGISPQNLDSHEKFARNDGLNFPLLADVDRAAIKAYGISVPGLGLRRSFDSVDTLAREIAALSPA